MPTQTRQRKRIIRQDTENRPPIRTFFDLNKIIRRHRNRFATVKLKFLRGPRVVITATYRNKIVLTKLPLRPEFYLIDTYDKFPGRYPPVVLAHFTLAGYYESIENFYIDFPHLQRFRNIDLTTIDPEYSTDISSITSVTSSSDSE